MNGILTGLRRGQRGQSIVILALGAVALIGIASLAVDQGMAQADRRDIQAAVDQASLAGTREYSLGNNVKAAHFVALQYLSNALKLTLSSVSPACTSAGSANCSNTAYTLGAYTFTFTDNGQQMDVRTQHVRPTLLAGVLGINQETVGTSARARPVGPTTVGTRYTVFAAGGDLIINGGGTNQPTGDISGSVYADGNIAPNNCGAHDTHCIRVPANAEGPTGAVCSPTTPTSVDAVGTAQDIMLPDGNTPYPTNQENTGVAAKPDPFQGVPAPVPPATTYSSEAAAEINGVWQPGTYNGIRPHDGPMAPGIYKITNFAFNANTNSNGSSLGTLYNQTLVTDGTVNKSGAVALLVDSTDSGILDLAHVHLQGLDDDGTSPRDPQGTHNFVIWGPAFSGTVNLGQGAGDNGNLTGIVDLPNASSSVGGNSTFTFYGSFVIKSITVNGGGNSTMIFHYVCNIAATEGSTHGGGLIK